MESTDRDVVYTANLDLITDETHDPCLQIASEGTDSNKMVCCKHEPALDVALGIMPTGGDSHHSKAAHLILKRLISSSSQAKALVGSWKITLLLLYTAGGNIRISFGNRVDIAQICLGQGFCLKRPHLPAASCK